MRIISYASLRQSYEKHTDAKESLRLWYTVAKRAGWQSFVEIQMDYPSARTDGRLTIFKIKGNNYRLIVRIEFELKRIYIRHVLTHEEYNKKDWKKDAWY